MTKLMENKVAVITGAGSGIGRSAALKLAEYGANIALLDQSEQKAYQVQEEIKKLGREALVIQKICLNQYLFNKLYKKLIIILNKLICFCQRWH